MDQQPPDPIKDNVLHAIESGEVKMRPKWKHITQTGLFAAGVLLFVLASLYLSSFIVFSLRESGVWFAPSLGFSGLQTFFSALPWALIVVAIVFLFLLQVMVRHYAFAYASPLLYSVLVLLGVVVIGGVALGISSFHQAFHPPHSGRFYGSFGQPPENVSLGTIIEIDNPNCIIADLHKGKLHILISPVTQVPPQVLQMGDVIMVLGSRDGSNVKALAIKKLDRLPPHIDDDDLPPASGSSPE